MREFAAKNRPLSPLETPRSDFANKTTPRYLKTALKVCDAFEAIYRAYFSSTRKPYFQAQTLKRNSFLVRVRLTR